MSKSKIEYIIFCYTMEHKRIRHLHYRQLNTNDNDDFIEPIDHKHYKHNDVIDVKQCALGCLDSEGFAILMLCLLIMLMIANVLNGGEIG